MNDMTKSETETNEPEIFEGEDNSDKTNVLNQIPKFEPNHTFKLTVPVKGMTGQMIEEVTLRSPNGLDLFEIGGYPSQTVFQEGGRMTVEMNPERSKRWILRLCKQLDTPTLYRLAGRDIRSMNDWIAGELSNAGN